MPNHQRNKSQLNKKISIQILNSMNLPISWELDAKKFSY
jgi:hypothetical protein